jgi:hypothetical protein
MATEYVRLTFKPAGAKRSRTVWAERSTRSKLMFWTVNAEGERPDPEELIVVGATDHRAIPATMSKKYAWLMLPGDPDLNNDIDKPTRLDGRT